MTLSANPRGEDSAGGYCGNSGGEEDRRTTITEGLQPRKRGERRHSAEGDEKRVKQAE